MAHNVCGLSDTSLFWRGNHKFSLDCLTLEDTLSRNVDNYQSTLCNISEERRSWRNILDWHEKLEEKWEETLNMKTGFRALNRNRDLFGTKQELLHLLQLAANASFDTPLTSLSPVTLPFYVT